MPMISFALRLQIPVLQLVGVLANFQKKFEADGHKPAPTGGLPVQQQLPTKLPDDLATVATNSGGSEDTHSCCSWSTLTPCSRVYTTTDGRPPMHSVFEAVGHKPAHTGGLPVQQQLPTKLPDELATVATNSGGSEHTPPPPAPPVASTPDTASALWAIPIYESQAYAQRVKWSALADQTSTRWTWLLEKEGVQLLTEFEPLPCEPPKLWPMAIGIGKQPPGPPPHGSTDDCEQESMPQLLETGTESEMPQPPPGSTADAEHEAMPRLLLVPGAESDMRQPPPGAPPQPPSGRDAAEQPPPSGGDAAGAPPQPPPGPRPVLEPMDGDDNCPNQ